MSRGTSLQIEDKNQRKLIMTQKDYQKVKQWYQSCKVNFFPLNQEIDTYHNQVLKEVHFRIYFSQIYISENYLTRNFNLVRSLAEDGLFIVGGIYKQTQKQLKGKLYESQKLKVSFNLQTKSIILANQINFFVYSYETKKRDSIFTIEFILTNTQGEQFRLGKLQYNINLIQPYDIVEIFIINQSGEKTGYIQCIIDREPIKQINKYLPTNVIFDQKCKIPPFLSFQMKKKKQNFILKDKVKLNIKNLEITIQNITKLKQKLLKLNPFLSLHTENVTLNIIGYDLILGSHNTWTFLQFQKQPNLITLIEKNQQNSVQSESNQTNDQIVLKPQKNQLIKSYFDCKQTVFLAILIVNVSFQYRQVIKKSSQTLGWSPIIMGLSQFQLKFSQILEVQNSIHNFPLRLKHNNMKIRADIINPKFQLFIKKQDERLQTSKTFIKSMYDLNQQVLIMKKTFKLKKSEQTQNYEFMQSQIVIDPLDKELQAIISQVQNKFNLQNKKVKLKGFIFSQRTNNTETEKTKQQNWEHLLSLQNKTVKIGIKISSIIPNTDEKTYLKGKYYLPKILKIRIFIMRKQIQAECKVEQNQVTFGIPVFLKTKKQMIFMETPIKSFDELAKIRDSSLIVSIFDVEKNIFYAKGFYKMSKILNENDYFKINVELLNEEFKMGHLSLQMFLGVKKIDMNYKREVQQISNQKILRSLPLKERMMMRIANYNKSTNDMQIQAINYYKQKTHQAVVQNITSQQVNNQSVIQYEIGEPSYYLIEYTNNSTSQNNLFTLFIKNCLYAQIVTNEVQFKKVCEKIHNEKKVSFHKINFEMGPQGTKSLQNGHYSCKILHNQTICILIKIWLQEWSSKIKQISNFNLDILRNTIPAKNYKFKIVFKQPIINQFGYLQEFNVSLNNKIIASQILSNLWKKYNQIVSFSKLFYISNSKKQFRLQMGQFIKKNQKLELLVQGKIIGESRLENMLIQIKLLQGQQIKLQLGEIYQGKIRISSYQHQNLINNFLVLKDNTFSEQNTLVSFENKIYPIIQQINIIHFTVCKLEQGLTNILINFLNLDGSIMYQYLLKISARLKIKPIEIYIQNYIGYQFLITCENKYIEKSKFYLQSNSRALFIEYQTLKISKNCPQKISIEVIDKITENVYIFLYDECFKVNEIYQIKISDEINQQKLR